MRGFDRLVFILLISAVIYVAVRDFSEPGKRRPPPDVQISPKGTLAAPSNSDPMITIEAERKRGNSTGTAFSIDDDGIWLTARHVTSGCREIWLQTGQQRGLPVLRVSEHPTADVAVVITRRGSPPLALSTVLDNGQEGFHFGYPRGRPGEAHSQLLGHARLRTVGMRRHVEPIVAWAELRRHPRNLDALSGMSGGPVLDGSGNSVGVTIATSRRRGRVFTAAPRSIREALNQAGVKSEQKPGHYARGALNSEDFPRYGNALRTELTVAKVICLVANKRRRPSF